MAHGTTASLRKRRLGLESLEGRALLSDLAVTLTTDESVYQAGQPIVMTLTETNTGSQPVGFVVGPSIDGFDVSENGKPVWQSNAGINPMFLVEEMIQPGQSYTLTATWDGVPNLPFQYMFGGQPPVLAGGSFTVTNQLDPNGASASFTIDSPLSYSITADQGNYSVGQPIQITSTETNTSSQPVTVNTTPSDFAITQEGIGAPLANVLGTWGTQSATETLQPGQSISETATWNGFANVGSQAGANAWGNISVSNPTAPQGVSADFSIANPYVTGLAASSPSFASGQPVTLSYTVANSADVPVTLLDSPASFSIQEELPIQYPEVFSQTGSGPGALVTLEPGASVTQTATWTPSGGQAPVGSYQAYCSGPVDGAFADFQVGVPDSISTTFSTDKSEYAVGEPIQITLSETNTSGQPVTINTGPSEFTITTDGAYLVANVSGAGGTQSPSATLQPGQSFTQTATWNGVANIGPSQGANVWGDFSISSQNAPLYSGATFQIAQPVTTSLVASSPSFAPDQPVTLTFTETNSADIPVAVVDYPGSFSIENLQTNTVVFSQAGSWSPMVVTLPPGASLTRSATWTPGAGQAPAGSYSGQYSDPMQSASTTFQIGSSSNTAVNEPTSSSPAPSSTPSAIVASLATARPTVPLGQPAAFTLTLSNQSNHTVDITPKNRSGDLTIYHGSQVVWQSRKLTLRGHKTLAAGQSVKLRGIWSGTGDERVESRLGPGTYTIDVKYDGYAASKTIQIEG
jgi:hypothetical protein